MNGGSSGTCRYEMARLNTARSLPITARAKEILSAWMAKSKCDHVFTREDGVSPVSASALVQQQERMRSLLDLPWDACAHSARHTALMNLGLTGMDPFTLQRAAGHSSITTTRKYVHPTPESMKDAFKKKTSTERSNSRKATRKRSAKAAVMGRLRSSRRRLPDLGTLGHKTWGILGDSGLLSVTFRYRI
jgi:hypothetical protein